MFHFEYSSLTAGCNILYAFPIRCALDMQTTNPRLPAFFRGSGEELQAWRRRQNPEYHHGHEGAHEDQGEKPTRSV